MENTQHPNALTVLSTTFIELPAVSTYRFRYLWSDFIQKDHQCFAFLLTVLALQVEELLLNAGQLALQGLHGGLVLILQLPQLFPVGLTPSLDLGRQVGLNLRQICPQSYILRLHGKQP